MNTYVIPNNLRQETKDYMTEVVKQLEDNGVMATVDSAALNILARQYDMYVQASDELSESQLVYTNSAGNLTPNPLVQIMCKAQSACFKLMKEFGLTAKARTVLPQMNKDDESPLLAFIKEQQE